MAKPAVRQLIQLRRQLDRLEDDVRSNAQETQLASTAAIVELRTVVGDERLVKFAGDTWTLRHESGGIRVIPQVLDEDI